MIASSTQPHASHSPAGWPRWCEGPTGSGKTAWLVDQLLEWANPDQPSPLTPGQTVLVFAAIGDNRLSLADYLASRIQGQIPVDTTTPSGFIQDEVTLFWPLLVPHLGPMPQFPLQLRPENEEEFATRFWQAQLRDGSMAVEGWSVSQTVSRALDFFNMAAAATIPVEDLPTLLPEGIPAGFAPEAVWRTMGEALMAWRDWCLNHSLLTYGVMTELYWRYLLPHPLYQEKLLARYGGVWVDDLDEYPAVTAEWLRIFMAHHRPVALTWNPQGKVRLGVRADPDRLEGLRESCAVVETLPAPLGNLANPWADLMVDWVADPLAMPTPLEPFHSLQTVSRGALLRQVGEVIAQAVAAKQVTPGEIAILGPGLDAIARYTLAEILLSHGIPAASLNDQRPLIHSPLVRALLTLITFVYPNLGHLADADSVAEMLVVLSQRPQPPDVAPWFDTVQIDPVRAELLVDHCFAPQLDRPQLLPVERFERWYRLGYRATQCYNHLRQWIAQQQEQRQQRFIPGVVGFLDRAIQTFYGGGHHLPSDQLTALRELVETAQQYWTVDEQLRQRQPSSPRGQFSRRVDRLNLAPGGDGFHAGLSSSLLPDPAAALIPETSATERFITLLRQGTVAANPYPAQPLDPAQQGVVLATVFQYRLQRMRHRWHFWLDVGSPRWLSADSLFGFPIFLSSYAGRPWRSDDLEALHQARLERTLHDLLGRATERVFLCHSDLAVSGQEQVGPLLTLLDAASSTDNEETLLEQV
ncbi:hypothetical protein [Leptolyngbya sp. BL0902]|uniref:hypothetical protein n=1 Tax=Leptolyngbya sp. BL0902 TaxID=1115757 RepID=UPI0018E88CA7|nr:hypothetical protein [Leptolyngbya sp. BL0902]